MRYSNPTGVHFRIPKKTLPIRKTNTIHAGHPPTFGSVLSLAVEAHCSPAQQQRVAAFPCELLGIVNDDRVGYAVDEGKGNVGAIVDALRDVQEHLAGKLRGLKSEVRMRSTTH